VVVQESIKTSTLVLVALLAPAIIIAFICLVLVPGPSSRRTLTKSQAIRRKVWELYAGLTGLALSLALAFFVTQGLKIIYGKPRPHTLALCNPDLANIAQHIVGGDGQDISIRWTLVNATICRTPDAKTLRDTFQSFPSGHCSFSWSGLLYLSLFVCAKFGVTIPYLPLQPMTPLQRDAQHPDETELLPLHHRASSGNGDSKNDASPAAQRAQPTSDLPLYNQAATPPNYGLLFVLIPLGVAAYIASTRYSEYWHDGFDVISGTIIGIVAAFFSFRWYHLPIVRGHGWAWGPRSRNRAFAIGVGVGSYVGPEGWASASAEPAAQDVAGRSA
jgi:membrane-associated phospholipid phosphatase